VSCLFPPWRFTNSSRFLLPVLHLRHLNDQISPKNLKKALDNLPNTIFETYEEAMLRIQEALRKDKECFNTAIRIFAWIKYAITPLTVRQLQHGLAVDSQDPRFDDDGIISRDRLFENLTSLITTEQSTVDFVHRSVREFFDDSGKKMDC